jgi:hypothetical protein
MKMGKWEDKKRKGDQNDRRWILKMKYQSQ